MQARAEVDVLPAPTGPYDPSRSWQGSRTPTKFTFGGDDEDVIVEDDPPRAASYTDLPSLVEGGPDGGIKRTFSENVLALPSGLSQDATKSIYKPHKELLRRASQKSTKATSRRSPARPQSQSDNSNGHIIQPQAADVNEHNAEKKEKEHNKAQLKSVSGTIRGLVKKPWKSPSKPNDKETKKLEKAEKAREKSPVKQKFLTLKKGEATTERKPSISAQSTSTHSTSRSPSPAKSNGAVHEKVEKEPVTRRPTILSKGRRPLSAFIGTRSDSEAVIRKSPSLRSLKSSFSMEKMTSPSTLNVTVPPLPQDYLHETTPKPSLDSAKRKDPLWGAFRAIEGDFQKFQSKSSNLKVNVIRSSLLPFLSKYATHASTTALRVEDLDRRIMILNKWWIVLMEMLNGRNNQSISGMDRPVYLEAITGIMTRPEWRIPPLSSSINVAEVPAPNRADGPAISTTSLASSSSDFLTDSIYQNVRNMFVQNLLSQMAFVVEKMSMRTAPASLVTFCGKACAYAFFFCPGVADILTRLWTLSPDCLRRILSECGAPRGTNFRQKSQEIAALFPEAVRVLSFESHGALCRRLRQQPSLPLGASSIRWFGPWINRWTGRESDLFFVFAKQFHVLVSEFIPGELAMCDRPCVPGLVLVHGQLLAVLEATLYRQAQAGSDKLEQLSYTLFDEIEGPDASAAAMPLTAANAVRSIAENRLIMLLRDLLADKNPVHHNVRQLYATSFDNVVKAAARRISKFDNNACFVLCDFMEEVLVITFRYQQHSPEIDLFDWPFWFEALRKMLESHNTLTEVRLFAFIYSMWHILIDNTQRRRDLCLNWLLAPSFFSRYYNHWSPMVRGYYYRLLCWRVARIDEQGVDDSEHILRTLQQRLNELWGQFLYLQKDAEDRQLPTPSTAPCSPAPGRRLVILRIDSHPLPPPFFMSLENSSPQKRQNQSTPYRTHSSLLNSLPPPEESPSPSKKRWSLLKGIVPFSNPGNSRPGEVTPPGSASDENFSNGEETPHPKSLARNSSGGSASETGTSSPAHQPFSFKFSLEWLDRPSWPSRNRQLAPPRLPQFAQDFMEGLAEKEVLPPIVPAPPRHDQLPSSRYCGRALAEWGQVVSECNSFFDRRRDEGVPLSKLVETPTLSVDSFRMLS